MGSRMYDEFSADYDRFVDWPARLGAELPFIEQQLQRSQSHRVLDVACGTGRHVIALAERGYEVVGVDLSAAMVERARAGGQDAGVDTGFDVAGFGEVDGRVGGDFDALLCLGNSLPHLLTPDELTAALDDFAACLRPAGLLLIQNRNFDLVLSSGQRRMEPQNYRENGAEWLFVRFYDFEADGALTFNLLTLTRSESAEWMQRWDRTRLRPLLQEELVAALGEAGFADIASYGDMSGSSFDRTRSGNLVVTARRAAARG